MAIQTNSAPDLRELWLIDCTDEQFQAEILALGLYREEEDDISSSS